MQHQAQQKSNQQVPQQFVSQPFQGQQVIMGGQQPQPVIQSGSPVQFNQLPLEVQQQLIAQGMGPQQGGVSTTSQTSNLNFMQSPSQTKVTQVQAQLPQQQVFQGIPQQQVITTSTNVGKAPTTKTTVTTTKLTPVVNTKKKNWWNCYETVETEQTDVQKTRKLLPTTTVTTTGQTTFQQAPGPVYTNTINQVPTQQTQFVGQPMLYSQAPPQFIQQGQFQPTTTVVEQQPQFIQQQPQQQQFIQQQPYVVQGQQPVQFIGQPQFEIPLQQSGYVQVGQPQQVIYQNQQPMQYVQQQQQ